MKQNVIGNTLTNNVMNGFKPDYLHSHSLFAATILPVLAVTSKVLAYTSVIGTIGGLVHSHTMLGCLLLNGDTPDSYEDNLKVFTNKVNVKALGYSIKHDFMPYMNKKCHWFVIWYLLRINGCLDLDKDRIDFCKQMKEWYGDSFSLYCLDAYAATCLTNTNWRTWETEVFKDFEKNEREAIEQGRVSLRTAKKMLMLCKQFDPIIKEKCLSNE